MNKIVLVIALALAIYSCDTADPGCLDLIAENYDVFAFEECDSCCVFPNATLSAAFKYDTITPFSFTTKYELSETDSVIVSDIQISLSDFTFFENGSPLRIIDSLRNESPTVYDDFVLFQTARRSRTIGQTNYLRLIDSIVFHTGLDPDVLDNLEPVETVVADSRFSDLVGTMYVDSIDQLFQLRIDVEIADSLREIEIVQLPFQAVGWSTEIQLEAGTGWSIPIYIDIKRLLKGISSEDSNEQISATIASNLSNSIEKR